MHSQLASSTGAGHSQPHWLATSMQRPRDLDECMRQWALLRPEALAILAQYQLHITPSGIVPHKPPGSVMDPLVRRFRLLREALMSCGCQDAWAVEVYELSADVCALASNTAELLKCLQSMVNTLYPAVEEQEARIARRRQEQQLRKQDGATVEQAGTAAGLPPSTVAAAAAAAPAAACVDPWDDSRNEKPPAGLQQSCGRSSGQAKAAPLQAPVGVGVLSRQAEVHGALLLWFLAVPACPVHAEVAKRLRATPPRLLASQEVRLSLRAASALMRGNWVQLAACAGAAPPLVSRVMEQGAAAARARAARAMAVAYRSLPMAALAAAIGPGGRASRDRGGCGDELELSVLREALERARNSLGCRGAGIALADIDDQLAGRQPAGGDLRFR